MRFLYGLDEVSPASFTASLPREIQVQDDSSSSGGGGRGGGAGVGRRLQCEQRRRKGHNNMEQESAPGLAANEKKGLSNSDPVQGTTNIVIEKSHSTLNKSIEFLNFYFSTRKTHLEVEIHFSFMPQSYHLRI